MNNIYELASELATHLDRELGNHRSQQSLEGHYVYTGLLLVAQAIALAAIHVAEAMPRAGRGT